MFDSISIRPAAELDLGFLAEVMLFYGRVQLVVNKPQLLALLMHCDHGALFQLIDNGFVELLFDEIGVGVLTQNSGTPLARHQARRFSISGQSLQDVVPEVCTEAVGKSGKGRRLSRRLMARIQAAGRAPEVVGHVESDFLDRVYLEQAIRLILMHEVPDFAHPPGMFFVAHRDENGFRIQTNIDFDRANELYLKRQTSNHTPLRPQFFLSCLVTARDHLDYAAINGSELATAPLQSDLIAARLQALGNKLNRGRDSIHTFQELLLYDGRAIREAVNSGERSLWDVVALLENSWKFREWLRAREPSAGLVGEYFHAIAAESSWLEKTPVKVMRWSVFTGLGLAVDLMGGGGIGTAAGVVLSFADAFILDRLMIGWKPDQFVRSTLAPFAAREIESGP